MRALAVRPGHSNSGRLLDVPEPSLADGALLVQALAMGVCGTDIEIIEGRYGWAPPGVDRLIIGHESLGRVVKAPDDSSLRAGDLVVGIVRRPDPVPCPYRAAGEWNASQAFSHIALINTAHNLARASKPAEQRSAS